MYSACSPVVLHTVPYINHMLINVLGKLDVEALATAKNKAWSPNGVIIKKKLLENGTSLNNVLYETRSIKSWKISL